MKHLIGVVCCVVAMPLLAQGKVTSETIVQRDFGSDRFAAGKLLIVERPVSGDLIAAGSEIEVATTVAGDALLAGGSVVVSKASNQSLYATAGKLLINDAVGRNARVAGGAIEFSPISVPSKRYFANFRLPYTSQRDAFNPSRGSKSAPPQSAAATTAAFSRHDQKEPR